MGNSSSGILTFGIFVGEDSKPEFLDDFDNDFESFVHHLSGLPGWGEPGHDWAKSNEFRKAYPLDLIPAGHHEYPLYILAIRDSTIEAGGWDIKDFNPENLIVTQEQIDFLKSFCEEYGIEYEEPSWKLTSNYG